MRKTVCFMRILAVLLSCIILVLTGCARKGSAVQTRWSLTSEIQARIEDNGNYGYILFLDGSGNSPDYESAKDAPWYSISGRVSEIRISEGIKNIGRNTFAACTHVGTAVIPESVTSIGENAFEGSVRICAYKRPQTNVRVWLYSQEKPLQGGYYWHYEDGHVRLWDVKKVLFIGNSFTYTQDMDRIFGELANSAGVNVITERIAIGAHNVSQFADPDDEGGAQVERHLTLSGDYDFVVLQEQSTRALDNYGLFVEGSGKIQKRVSETQDSCELILYATWGYPKQASVKNQSVQQMEMQLRQAYEKASSELGVRISPVGEAFSYVLSSHPEIDLYSSDGQHPSYAGAFLAACVHVGTLLALDPRTAPFDGAAGGLSARTSEILKEAAYAVVSGHSYLMQR